MMNKRSLAVVFSVFICVLALTACNTMESEAKYPTGADRDGSKDDIYAEKQSVFGPGGLGILGGDKKDKNEDGSSGIGVNSFLWRASLDTVSFMPLASADPFGGVILTDWYSPPENAAERFKVNVFILGRQLRSDGVRVRVFRQVQEKGAWHDSDVASDMGTKLEDTILTRARQLRISQLGQDD